MGYTPLHQAAQQGHVLVVNLLLKYQASPNVLTNVRLIHLHFCVPSFIYGTLRRLLSAIAENSWSFR